MGTTEDQRNTDEGGDYNVALAHPPSPLFQSLNDSSHGSTSSADQHPSHDMEAVIHSEAEALSPEAQQQVENDVLGKNPSHHHHATLGHTVPGEPQRLTAIELQSLQREFQQLVQTRPEYQTLVSALEYDYVKDQQLRLKMLRAENYDVRMAALRLANFFKLLQEIFGPYLLMRPIQLLDLTQQERQLQRKGLQQLFKFRDQTGRRIMGCFDVHFPPTASFESQVRWESRACFVRHCFVLI
jgi:hypothetical protein